MVYLPDPLPSRSSLKRIEPRWERGASTQDGFTTSGSAKAESSALGLTCSRLCAPEWGLPERFRQDHNSAVDAVGSLDDYEVAYAAPLFRRLP